MPATTAQPSQSRTGRVPVFDKTLLDTAHLMRRAGFGATSSTITTMAGKGLDAAISALVNYEQTPDNFVPPDSSIIPADFTSLKVGRTGDLSAWWLQRMIATSRPLQEKMTLFWHGHFATAIGKVRRPYLMYQQNQIFRNNALGRFDDLLSAVYKDPAMLIWLDGDRNTKAAPNENWGREVMELFTLGRGNYTEDDVHADARAFTGWTLRKDGTTVFNPRQHDEGIKTLLGQTGNWGSEDAVRILAAHPATGPFLAGRIWRFFASDRPPSNVINKMASVYYSSNHSIKDVVRTMFSSPEFYLAETKTGHIKSPVEFMVVAVRQLGLTGMDVSKWPFVLASLGQELFNPPNVGGWPGGVAWVNAGTLLGRFNFASMLTGDSSRGPGSIDADTMAAESGAATMDELVPYIDYLFGLSMTDSTRNALLQYAGKSSIESGDLDLKVRGLVHLALMSPEFQAS